MLNEDTEPSPNPRKKKMNATAAMIASKPHKIQNATMCLPQFAPLGAPHLPWFVRRNRDSGAQT
jgi:hypothetical protein